MEPGLFRKFEFTKQTFSHTKLLGKGIQENVYFNNILSIESTFLANLVICKHNQTLT